MYRSAYLLIACVITICHCGEALSADFDASVRPLLEKYCAACHSGDDASGEVDFAAVNNAEDVARSFEVWDSVAVHLRAHTMPPEDETQPTNDEREEFYRWYQDYFANIEARPAVMKPRRLSVVEYRNTLRSVFGFDLDVAVIEAEQTLAEKSLVLKLLPTDPPGESGFKNDTHRNPLNTVAWDQYSYLADTAIERLFSKPYRDQLESFTGDIGEDGLQRSQAERLLREFLNRSQRRPVEPERLANAFDCLRGQVGEELLASVKLELKAALMSPEFLYRGLLVTGTPGQRQAVDQFELAERLSYFLWADMPDGELLNLAANGRLAEADVLASEVDRLLASPKASSLAEVFATEWLTLNEIEHVSNDVPKMVALKSQPLDFMNYLFTENRPLLELIASRVAFINPHTARMYRGDSKQMTRYVKQRGIEVEIVPNQKIHLKATVERGGILTMPGVLAMNKGPILRGTWMLERILGQELPEPPANVGQVPPNNRGEELSFRQRFGQHRSNPSCAVCHDKIDPLGFALQGYANDGQYLLTATDNKKKKGKADYDSTPAGKLDTSGQLPSGERFEDFEGLKQILVTSQREAVIRNIVERTMSYALCRKLIVYDRPTVDVIVNQMNETNGTWKELFLAIIYSVSFQETILSDVD